MKICHVCINYLLRWQSEQSQSSSFWSALIDEIVRDVAVAKWYSSAQLKWFWAMIYSVEMIHDLSLLCFNRSPQNSSELNHRQSAHRLCSQAHIASLLTSATFLHAQQRDRCLIRDFFSTLNSFSLVFCSFLRLASAIRFISVIISLRSISFSSFDAAAITASSIAVFDACAIFFQLSSTSFIAVVLRRLHTSVSETWSWDISAENFLFQ